ncbi:MAG: SCO family protein, partial [Pseudomonadota bacterium]
AGLTGSTAQIADAVKVYRAYARKREDPSNSDGYTMDHSSFLYLMAPNGEFITHFTHVSPVDKMVERLSAAL